MIWTILFKFQRISISSISQKLFPKGLNTINMPYYAVARGRSVGIFQTWGECEAQVKGFSGARYKKFDSPQSAEEFINAEGGSVRPPAKSNKHPYQASYSNPNLKRSYSTTSYDRDVSTYKQNNDKKKRLKPKQESTESEDFSDASDDLADIINKQMDDIEKRVNNFSKGIDKIMKKSSGSGPGRRAIMIEPPQPKKHRSNNKDFEEDGEGYVKVYTDGACSANGQKGARAGLGVFWGDQHPLNVSEPVSGRATNNCGEIQAATCAIKQALENGISKLAIYTDSQFLINSVTKWLPGWKRKGWKLASGEPVKNEKDFKELDSIQHKLHIKWIYVEAHKGIHGNEMADQLARAGAAMYEL
ncbi:ribonuclease H1-like [Pectinophora gossypiella]|uniref:ribonuclease H1-like n=1 Tax=Pectinophora gossypiella TaxID=13191 RepID=UPI00214F2327|nr:ribonuclease H1-like [Pectinophora gossypiella]